MNPYKNNQATWAARRDIVLTVLGWICICSIIFLVLYYLRLPLILFMIALFLAYALAPSVRMLERFLPRSIAIILVYLVVLTVFCFLIYFSINTAVQQFAMLDTKLHVLLTPKDHNISPFMISLQKLGISQTQITTATNQLTSEAEKLISSIVPFLSSLFTSILDIVVISIMSIYLLIDGPRIKRWLQTNMPTSYQGQTHFIIDTFQRIIANYIRGQVFLAMLLGILIGVGMALFHVPYAVLLGVLAFLLGFVPILGTFISAAVCILLALTQGWVTALFVTAYFIFVHVVEAEIVGPSIVGKALGLHPIISILALIAGSELYGIAGALFASPIAGVMQAVLVALWSEWKKTHPEAFKK